MKKTTKLKKALTVTSAMLMTASMSIFNVSAAENETAETNKKVAWTYEYNPPKAYIGGDHIICYDDGSIDNCTIDPPYNVVYTFPEGVEPTLEYVNDKRIVKINKYEQSYYHFDHTGNDYFSDLEEGDNKYVFQFDESIDYIVYTSSEDAREQRQKAMEARREVAKQLLADGKIISAEELKMVGVQHDKGINGIVIELDDETTEFTEDDLPDLSELFKVPYVLYNTEAHKAAGFFPLLRKNEYMLMRENKGISDKDTLLNIPEIRKAILESNPHITEVYIESHPILLSADNSENKIFASPIYMQGDANRNNQIDIIDAVSIAKYLLHPDTMDEETIKLADINNDGTTDIIDAVEIAKKLLEKNKK